MTAAAVMMPSAVSVMSAASIQRIVCKQVESLPDQLDSLGDVIPCWCRCRFGSDIFPVELVVDLLAKVCPRLGIAHSRLFILFADDFRSSVYVLGAEELPPCTDILCLHLHEEEFELRRLVIDVHTVTLAAAQKILLAAPICPLCESPSLGVTDEIVSPCHCSLGICFALAPVGSEIALQPARLAVAFCLEVAHDPGDGLVRQLRALFSLIQFQIVALLIA